MPQPSSEQQSMGDTNRNRCAEKSESHTDRCDGAKQATSRRSISSIPFESLMDNRTHATTGVISPLQLHDVFKRKNDGDRIDDDADDKNAPPVVEIIIPKPQQIDGSTCSINEDTVPAANCGAAEDYKHLFFCSQREIHSLKEHIACVDEENRQLKRRMIEMQRQLYAYSRNKRPLSTANKAADSAWSIPPTTLAKRHKVGCELSSSHGTGATLSPRHILAREEGSESAAARTGVRMSVSTEDCASEPNEMPIKA